MGVPARSYGGRSARQRVEERRASLVEAAISVLAAQGERATMTAICSRAGLTERYFYESFANRDAALVAALDQVTEDIAGDAVRRLQESTGSVEERVYAMALGFARWAADHPDRALVSVVRSNATDALRTRRHELLRQLAETATHDAATLYGDRAWPPAQARLRALVLLGGVAELLSSWLTGEVDLSTEDLADVIGEMFLQLLRRPDEPVS